VKILTFISDFGLSDPYVGEVKGVVKAVSPDAEIIDITHGIEPGNLLEASFVLAGAYRYFSAGSVHLVVVDPGVGTGRDIIAVHTADHCFIGPDNGVLHEAVKEEGENDMKIYALDRVLLYEELSRRAAGNRVVQRLLDAPASATFHGRDLFAPLAGLLLEEVQTRSVCVPCDRKRMERLDIPVPVEKERSVTGTVLHIDRFGNLITNIPGDLLRGGGDVFIHVKDELVSVGSLVGTYADVEAGKPVALISSRRHLEIAVNGGSARDYFAASCGDEILVMRGRCDD
jgi:S-adenosylmethionine hydrolase